MTKSIPKGAEFCFRAKDSTFDVEIPFSHEEIHDRKLLTFTPGKQHTQVAYIAAATDKTRQTRNVSNTHSTRRAESDDDSAFLKPIAQNQSKVTKTAVPTKSGTRAAIKQSQSRQTRGSSRSNASSLKAVLEDDDDASVILEGAKTKKK